MEKNFHNGPDQIVPTENFTTTQLDSYVRLRIPQSGKAIETTPPISIPGLLKRTAETHPHNKALTYKVGEKWTSFTYKEYLENVRICAKAFLHLGLNRHHSVGILGFNSPEWFISDLGAIFAGGIAVGIYTTNSSEACFYCLEHSNADFVVVQDNKQLEKISSIKERLPNLKKIIQYEGEPTDPEVLSWKQFMDIGRAQKDDLLEEILKSIAINECCTLVYTSGTVGNPKAVMLSHDNLTWDALSIGERANIKVGEERIISYLPLSHVAAQVVDIYLALSNAAQIFFADKDALKGSLVNTLQDVRPTKFLAVPRVWEKIYEKMMQVAAQNNALKRNIADWAKSRALEHHFNQINGSPSNTWGYYIARVVIFKKVKQALGLDQCDLFASAAAPLAPDVKRYFLSIDLPIMEAFGMSEASGAHTICTPTTFGLETIGPEIPGVRTELRNPENGQGEICLKGRHVFMGYLGDPEKTAEAIDSEGWLHTGDLGRIDERNLIYITGRLKELLITAGGENIPPVHIEQLVKAELPHISSAFLIGDRRKFLAVLLTLKTEIDPETTKPIDKLTREAQHWLESLGCPATTVSEVLKAGPDSKLLGALQEAIDKVNLKAISNAQKIQKFAILPQDFSIPTGELGPTMKVKRNVVNEKYAEIIEGMYK